MRKLEKQLLNVARDGYAVVNEEFEIGLTAIAVPIYNHLGNVIAAVSIPARPSGSRRRNSPGSSTASARQV